MKPRRSDVTVELKLRGTAHVRLLDIQQDDTEEIINSIPLDQIIDMIDGDWKLTDCEFSEIVDVAPTMECTE